MQLEAHLSASRVLSAAQCMTDRNEVGENLMWDRSLSLSYSERVSFRRKKQLQTKAAWVQFQRGTDLRPSRLTSAEYF